MLNLGNLRRNPPTKFTSFLAGRTFIWSCVSVVAVVSIALKGVESNSDRPLHSPQTNPSEMNPERIASPTTSDFVIGFLHLALPGWVLAIECHMLAKMKVESHERLKLEDQLKLFRTDLGREPYLQQIEAAIISARQTVLFTTFSMHHSRHSNEQRRIVDAVVFNVKNRSVYSHRGVIASRVEALPGTFELLFAVHKAREGLPNEKEITFEVRLSTVLSQTRLRFVTKDGERSIVGLSEGTSEVVDSTRQTTMSYTVESGMLASALSTKFEELFAAGETPWVFLERMIAESIKSYGAYSQKNVLDELGVELTHKDAYTKFIADNCEQFRNLPSL